MPTSPTTDLERFCGFAERFLTDARGRPLGIEPFQRQILADYFDGTRETVVPLSGPALLSGSNELLSQ